MLAFCLCEKSISAHFEAQFIFTQLLDFFFTIWIFLSDSLESVIEIFKGFQTLEVVAKPEFRKRLLSIVVFFPNLSLGDSHENTSDLF